jgi:hypothetical protein
MKIYTILILLLTTPVYGAQVSITSSGTVTKSLDLTATVTPFYKLTSEDDIIKDFGTLNLEDPCLIYSEFECRIKDNYLFLEYPITFKADISGRNFLKLSINKHPLEHAGDVVINIFHLGVEVSSVNFNNGDEKIILVKIKYKVKGTQVASPSLGKLTFSPVLEKL